VQRATRKLARGRVPETELLAFLHQKLDFWAPMGTMKIPGVAKNDPKNSIRRLFRALGRSGGAKKTFLRGSKKHMKLLSTFSRKCEALEGQNH
jgi:hypothetical protein